MLTLSLSMPQQPPVPRTGTPHLDLEAVMESICLQSSFDGVPLRSGLLESSTSNIVAFASPNHSSNWNAKVFLSSWVLAIVNLLMVAEC